MVFVTIVLDGVGIGEQPEASDYGDQGSDTLGHVLASEKPHLPNLEKFGLGCIKTLPGIAHVDQPQASFGKMTEQSAGKDSTTGHWEIAGITLDQPFPTYPKGFPKDLIHRFCDAISVSGVLGNRPESGTVILDECGAEHMATGLPIVYTSADSVFQVAAHVGVVPLTQLYDWCERARHEICVGQHAVGRVIARPFEGVPGAFKRLSTKRKDFSRLPHVKPVQQVLQESGVRTISVGKVADLFGGVGFSRTEKTGPNATGIATTIDEIKKASASASNTFIWTNLIDFDQEFGHRNNPEGFAGSLMEFDRALPAILEALPTNGRLVITADHGNDPTTPGSDHSREYVPLLYYDGGHARDLGTRRTFADHAATVASFFNVPFACSGQSFDAE